MEFTISQLFGIFFITALVYNYAEKILDKHWIKIRDIVRPKLKYFSDEDKLAMKNHYRLLHQLGVIPKVLGAFMTAGALFILYQVDYARFIIVFILFLTMNWIMDIFLNIQMGWGWFYRGSGLMDKVPFYVRALLFMALTTIYFILN